MCFDDMKDKAAAFEEAGVGVYENLCQHCPHIGSCGWSRQKEDKGPGLVVMPVDYAFEESANRADLQVFDESFLRATDSITKVNLSDLLSPLPSLPRRRGSSFTETWLDTALEDRGDLMTARSTFLAALDAADGKVPTFEQIREAGLTEEIARRAMGLEHQRADEIHKMISHEHSVEDIKETIASFQHRGARRWAALWRSLAEQFVFERQQPYGWRRWEEEKDGEILQRMLVRTTRDFRNQETPMLFLDATGDEEILRRFVPELTKVTQIAIELGNVTVTQVTDCPSSGFLERKVA